MSRIELARVEKNRIEEILNLITKTGLTTYKTKFSKASLPALRKAMEFDKQHVKGAVFAVRSKADFTPEGAKGYVITSLETLLEDVEGLTHWTPNVFRSFGYTDNTKRFVKGHEETQLAQINTFVVDIDTDQHSVQDILMSCIDNSIGRPTLIIKTNRGYQVYFVLDKPMYISNKNNFKLLKIAKRISQNIKMSLQSVNADLYCNDFGFFRIPNSQNVVWLDDGAIYSFDTLKNWSMRQDDDRGRSFSVIHTGNLPDGVQAKASLSDWFNALLHATNIKGGKGQIGRNNTMFTMALICMSEGKEESSTMDLLDEYNSRLDYPLQAKEVHSAVRSAYSGKYKGAQKCYVTQLLEQYVSQANSFNVKLGNSNGWYKHKKERSDRVRSHLEEWESDIIKYITAEKNDSEPFIWHTQKELCEKLDMPQSTLNKLLNNSKKIIKTVKGVGRNAKTGWSTVALFIKYTQTLALELQARKSDYKEQLIQLIEELVTKIEPIAGHDRLIGYLTHLDLLERSKGIQGRSDTG
ncbi:primase C-terminal domain-containing protein [Lysinibacillus sp. NPDC096418]|uniref:primase C-terminal domain-containing protein n=1 Tax=Lysinibacillus sp. NPDC096418 TaxID=3364138 RepID=UPI00381547BA